MLIYAFAKKASQAAPVGSFRSPDCQRIVFAHAGARARAIYTDFISCGRGKHYAPFRKEVYISLIWKTKRRISPF
jgi:hypothetical protein